MNIAIVLAGGTGSRMNLGYNKVFADLRGVPILARTIGHFENAECIDRIVVVAGNRDAGSDASDQARAKEIVNSAGFRKVSAIVAGGSTRMKSVSSGLEEASPAPEDVVLIQDGGRPFCSSPLIEELTAAANKHGAAICGATPKDTIQKIDDNGFAVDTFDRSKLLAIFTPVAAKWNLMKVAREEALDKGYLDTPGFEDSALLQKIGVPVKVVYSDYTNMKITTPEDLLIAEKIIDSL